MYQERGSALVSVAAVLLIMVTVSTMADAADYQVDWKLTGGTLQRLPRGMKLKAGDNLVFNYQPRIHNVVSVNKYGYDRCTSVPGNGRVYMDGSKDRVQLTRGANYFICTFAGHCGAGMKIKVIV